MTNFPSLGCRHLRTGRRSVPGQIYLITMVTRLRQPCFLNTDLARFAAQSLSDTERWHPSKCLCWVLMPDHWHGLVDLGGDVDLSTTVQRVKGITARIVGLRDDTVRPLWASGFHDHALRREESIQEAARYIIANPVRAGLVKDPMDYPYWDAYFVDGTTCLEGT